MKKALFFKKLKSDKVQCTLCPHFCIIENQQKGICKVRENVDGILYSNSYANPVSLAVDPIEKKPLYHFLPGSLVFSFGTNGCNFDCKNCQNYEISKSFFCLPTKQISPKKLVELALKSNAKSIAYTYTEPTVFYEYVFETAKLAKRAGLKNILVTNGFINKAPLLKLIPFIDAVNIDLKGSEEFYKKNCNGLQKPVLDTIRLLNKKEIFIEITNLIVPSLNDSKKDFEFISDFILSLPNNSKNIPLHFSAFFPTYKLTHLPKTKEETLVLARKMALEKGLNYVYLGNVIASKGANNTFCPKCKKEVIVRKGFFVEKIDLKNGFCRCNKKISGIFI